MIAKIKMRKKQAVLKDLLKDVRLLMKDFKVLEAERKTSPEVCQLRRLSSTYPLYFVLLEKTQFYQEFIFVCMPFTEDVELAFSKNTPLLRLNRQRTLLAGLPFWVYLSEEFLEKYSELIGTLPEAKVEKLKEFTESTSLEKITGTTKEYLEDIMRLLAPFNTQSLFTALEDLEAYWEAPQEISFDFKACEDLAEYAYALAASSKKVFRGKNWFGIVEEASENKAILTLYLPIEAVGKKAVIKLKGQVLFEGLIEKDKLKIELPLLPNYTFLEDHLEIQI